MRPQITVGLGGAGGWTALAWAVDEALTTGAALTVVHACPADSLLARGGPEPALSVVELADPPLARALSSARLRLGGDRVRLRIVAGAPDAVLASETGLVVIGPPGWHAVGSVSSTAHHVIAHARGPVVVVRPTRPGHGGAFAGHVVVAVTFGGASQAALGYAFAYADAHRRPLAAVHVADTVVDELWFDETTLSTHFATEPAVLSGLGSEIEPWMRKYPAVAVKRALLSGDLVDCLLRAAASARLLVVGGRGGNVVDRAPRRTVGDLLIERAPAPVAVVPSEGAATGRWP